MEWRCWRKRIEHLQDVDERAFWWGSRTGRPSDQKVLGTFFCRALQYSTLEPFLQSPTRFNKNKNIQYIYNNGWLKNVKRFNIGLCLDRSPHKYYKYKSHYGQRPIKYFSVGKTLQTKAIFNGRTRGLHHHTLQKMLTGTLSGYFFRIFSPSVFLFSKTLSSLYWNFIVSTTVRKNATQIAILTKQTTWHDCSIKKR